MSVLYSDEMQEVESGKCFSLFPLHPSAWWLAGAVCAEENLTPSPLPDEVAAAAWAQEASWPCGEDTLPIQSISTVAC